MKQTLQRGFTLIELLVVIAIIGILASVVLASLNDARSSGADASIQQQLANARSQAEIVYNSGGAFSYEGVCEDPKIRGLIQASAGNGPATDITTANLTNNSFASWLDATPSTWQTAVCHDSANNWAIAVPLNDSISTAASLWCVDGTGVARRTSTNLVAGGSGTIGYVCP